jgi:hypothetical protein
MKLSERKLAQIAHIKMVKASTTLPLEYTLFDSFIPIKMFKKADTQRKKSMSH